MIAVTPQMRIMVAIEPVDFRKGIDGISRVCKAVLSEDPFDGTLFVFRSRAAKAIKLLAYDGQGFWLAQKRLSDSKFRYWPSAPAQGQARVLLAHQFNLLIWGGDPKAAQAAPMWRPLNAASGEIRPS
jgi:transposase